MSKADLHLHTHHSDGLLSPQELIRAALSRNLIAVSITDHDSMAAYASLGAADGKGDPPIQLVPGVEFTSRHDGRDVHLLAYGLDPVRPEVVRMLAAQKKARWDRVGLILERLRSKGIQLTTDEVLGEVAHGNPGRPHIARAMVRNRMVADEKEAFRKFLKDEHLGSLPVSYPDAVRLTGWIREQGGVSSLAHPGLQVTLETVETLVSHGLDGVESIHPSHPYHLQKTYLDLAARRSLLVTGGSDFHGPLRAYEPYLGIVTLSKRHLDTLCAAISHRGGKTAHPFTLPTDSSDAHA